MKVTGTASLRAPREEVWRALLDPSVLVATIPGCSALEATGPDAYRMTVSAGVASIKGSYLGDVRLTDQQPPSSYVLRATGAGAPGTVDATARVTLHDADGGGTRLDYDADAVVGGPIGGVGQRVLAGVAKKMAGEFFRAVDSHLAGAGVPAATATPAGSPPPTVVQRFAEGTAALATGSSGDPVRWALVGAAIALAGVLVGARIARRR